MSAEEKRNRQVRASRNAKLKMILGWGVLLVLVGGTFAYSQAHVNPNNKVISSSGVHYHAHLSINIDGQDVPVPKGIGLIAGMEHPDQMHTHEADQVVHVEYPGRVREDDLRLGNFFKVWGKEFSKDDVLGNIAGGGKTITMTVNGKPNTDFDRYEIADKDDIKIVYGGV